MISSRSESLSVGVVGGGGIAENAHLPAYCNHSDIKEVSLAEIDDERRDELSDTFDLSNCYQEGMDLLERADIDLLSICTPPQTHERFFIEAAQRGIHIYCEKPVAPDPDSVARMADSADQAGIITQVGYTRPYIKNFKRVLQLEKNDILGEKYRLKTLRIRPPPSRNWYYDAEVAGGGVIVDQLPHMIDFYLRLFDTEPTIIEADIRQIKTTGVEDYAEITFDFDETTVTTTVMWGQQANMPGGNTSYHKNVLITDAGHIRYNIDEFTGSIYGQRLDLKRGSFPFFKLYTLYQLWAGTADEFQIRRIHDFIDHVKANDSATSAPIHRAVTVANIIAEIYETGENK